MKKTLFEQMGGTYTLVVDYYLPDLELQAEEDERPLGVWAQRRLNYIKGHRRALYSQLVMTGKLHSHLADVEEHAESLLLRLVDEMTADDGITEQLKATNQMEWVCRMNCIKEQATEIVMLVSIFVPSMSASAASNVYTSQANEGTYVVANMSEYSCGVSVRSTPSYDYGSIGTINANTAYKYLKETKTDSHGRDWYKIQYTNSETGWVCSYYTHFVTVNRGNYVLTTSSQINMRKGPNTGYASYGLCHANTYYSLIGCAGEGFSINGTKWYQVMDNNYRVFWFKSTLLSKVKITTNITCDVNSGTYFNRTYNFKGASYARTGPSTDYAKVRSSTFGTKCIIDITSVKLNTKGELWYGVQIRDGKLYNGYVLGTLLK